MCKKLGVACKKNKTQLVMFPLLDERAKKTESSTKAHCTFVMIPMTNDNFQMYVTKIWLTKYALNHTFNVIPIVPKIKH